MSEEKIPLEERLQGFFKADKYRSLITAAATRRERSIDVDFGDLVSFDEPFSLELVNDPERLLPLLDRAAYRQLQVEASEYASSFEDFYARVTNLPIVTSLREVRASNLGKLIMLDAIVVRASAVKPMLKKAVFKCGVCGAPIEVRQDTRTRIMKRPERCPNPSCRARAKSFQLDEEASIFTDLQSIGLQEKPEDLPAGQLPRMLEVRLTEDLVDRARPGDRVYVTGILTSVQERMGEAALRTFRPYLEAVNLETASKEPEALTTTAEEEKKFRQMASSPFIHRQVVESIAPSIYGMEDVKEAVMYLLFGGNTKEFPDGVRVRGDVNVLLVGDPGTAKSVLLQTVSKISPRGLYTSGRGSTAAGLTAAVMREKAGGMVLEAGAMVLADRGVCCLHPETHIVMDNRIATLEELGIGLNYESATVKGESIELAEIGGCLPSFDDEELRMSESRATLIRRKKYSGQILRIGLKTGNVLRLTPDHLLLDGDSLEWRPSSEFSVGNKVVAPLRLPGCKEPLYIWDILPDECLVSLTRTEKEELRKLILARFPSLSAAARKLGLSRLTDYYGGRLQPALGELKRLTRALGVEEEWRKRPHRYAHSRIRVATVTPPLGYILGFMRGDSRVKHDERDVSIVVTQSVKNRAYRQRFTQSWDQVFTKPLTIRHPLRRRSYIRGKSVESICENWSVSRRLLAYLYEYFFDEHARRILRLPDESLAGLTAGLIDSDGCSCEKFCRKDNREYGTWNITFTFTNDRIENQNFSLALRRFDCLAFTHDAGNIVKLVVSSRRDCKKLREATTEYSVKMLKPIPSRLKEISGCSEKLPARVVSKIMLYGFSQTPRRELLERGVWSTVYDYISLRRQPSSTEIDRIIKRTWDIVDSQTLDSLMKVKQRDYFLDEIESIEQEEYSGYVYDLYVPGTHNLVAEGVIVHNCIDEIDKMRPEDRVAIHEAMAQQTVSVAKGGIVTTLNARTAVMAAANPSLGRYDSFRTFPENVNLPVTILSRFDLIFILKDVPDAEQDRKISDHILALHSTGSPSVSPPIPPEVLRKYVSYAKRVRPEMSPEAMKVMENFFLATRAVYDQTSTVTITARQLESLIRLTEARARAAMRETVTPEDAGAVVMLIKKSLSQVGVDVETGRPDIDAIMTGKPGSVREKLRAVVDVVKRLSEERGVAEEEAVKRDLLEQGLTDADIDRILRKLISEGTLYSPRPGAYKLT